MSEKSPVVSRRAPARDPDAAEDARLRALGYAPQFRREMSLYGVLGISFCAIGILAVPRCASAGAETMFVCYRYSYRNVVRLSDGLVLGRPARALLGLERESASPRSCWRGPCAARDACGGG